MFCFFLMQRYTILLCILEKKKEPPLSFLCKNEPDTNHQRKSLCLEVALNHNGGINERYIGLGENPTSSRI